jgi:hypothetical protein
MAGNATHPERNRQAHAMFWKFVGALGLAAILSLGSLWVHPATSEQAQYGNTGSPAENWRPRIVAGWPAPFIADIPTISVPRQIGLEDEFRPGAFLGTFSFWLLAVIAVRRARRRVRR